MRKVFLFIISLMLPCFVFASGANYQESIHYANNYIQKFTKYNSYLYFRDKLEYVYENGSFSYNPDFKSAGFLSKTEYEISNSNNNTYLSNGLEYWTLTKSSANNHYVINYKLQQKADTIETGSRLTEYVKPTVGVTGRGTYADPWTFSEVLNIHLNSLNTNKGHVSYDVCSNAEMLKNTISVAFTKGSNAYGYICPVNGYTILTNTCSDYMVGNLEHKYTISGVNKDNLICNIDFTYSTKKVELSCDNCNLNPSPSLVYANNVFDKWFSDEKGLDEIDGITSKPSKTGYTFKGFFKDETLVIDDEGMFQTGAASKMIGNNLKLSASFEANKYEFTLDVDDATSVVPIFPGTVFYDGTLPNIQVPLREYTIIYNANGGTVSRTSDVVKHTFDGFFHNNVQYYNGSGEGVRTWNIPQNVSLTGRWSGGTISLPTVSKPGYRLVGWFTPEGIEITDGTTITKNLTLTAKWEAVKVTYTVKHYQETVTGGWANPTVETFEAYTATSVTPAFKSYTGFNSPATQSATVNGNGTTLIEYRYYRKTYAVTINRNDANLGTLDKSSVTVRHGTTYSVSSNVLTFNDGQTVKASITSKTGYTTTFSSWSPASGTITAATTITANFAREAIKYKYTFASTDSSLGSVSVSELMVPYDSTYTVSGGTLTFSTGQKVIANPIVKTGYTTVVNSWSSTSGTVKGTGSISVSFTRTANKYNIIYNCNGGTPTTATSSQHTYDQDKGLTAVSCTRTGFTFNSWNTEADGTGTTYGDGQTVSNLSDANNGTVTLYARWNDVTAPSCKLKATADGVSFETKSDNVGVSQYGLIKSSTATYNSTSSLGLSNGTFYGYVKDAAGNTNKCSITIGGTYVSNYTKTTKTCNRNVSSYTKTTKTCNRSVASYNKTTKTCNRIFTNYSKIIQTCGATSVKSYTQTKQYCDRSVQSYIRSYKRCNKSVGSYTKVTARCNASYSGTCTCKNSLFGQGYSYSCGSYSSCSTLCNAKGYSNSSGSCNLSTSWTTTPTTVSSCTPTSYFTCNIGANGVSYVQTCTPNYTYSFTDFTSSGNTACYTSAAFTCGPQTEGNVQTTNCEPVYSYSLGSPSSTTVSSCSANTFNCNASTYRSYYTTCTPYSYNYGFSGEKYELTSSCTQNDFTCSSSTSGQTKITCTKNYDYSFGTSSTSTTSSCTANNISCNSSTSGQTYVSCSTNYNYAFGENTTTESSCSTTGSFSCNSSNYGSSYVSGCSTNYNYTFGESTSSTSSCSTTGSFSCNSGNYGSSYVSSCTPAAYACNDSGYTKINNSYCYKY